MTGANKGRVFGPSLARANDATLLEAALIYAGELGLPVFPCNGKLPRTSRGFRDATTDDTQIKEWWMRYPNANIGMPTGEPSGLVVIDADGPEGIANAKELLGEARLTTLQTVTGGDGRHYFHEHPAGRRVSGTVSRLAPSVDIRGDGNYVILPPSCTEGPYRWANPDGEVPQWQRDTIDPRDDVAKISVTDLPAVEVEDETAQAKRTQLLANVSTAPEGTRNDALFKASSDLGFLVQAGALDVTRTVNELLTTATANGLESSETVATVISGLRNGASQAPVLVDPKTLDTALILDDTDAFLRRFVVFRSEYESMALALWVAHTWAIESAYITPYIVISSPEAESGKSRVLDVLGLLVRNPWTVIGPSEAVLYRKISKGPLTLLLDEYDTIFGGNNDHEHLRQALNAGYRRGTTVPRCSGKNFDEITEFEVFCPKALAGIGQPPDTIRTRQIPVRMRKKTPTDSVDEFLEWEIGEEIKPLRRRIEAWARKHTEALGKADRPQTPRMLTDRQKDIWRPLLLIADIAGGPWPTAARKAAAHLHTNAGPVQSDGVLLLEHIRDLFDGLKDRDSLGGEEIINELIKRDDGPWSLIWERAIKDERTQSAKTKLAKLLKDYVEPKKVQVGNRRLQGYERAQFVDAWQRYLVDPAAKKPDYPVEVDGRRSTPVWVRPDSPDSPAFSDPLGGAE